MICINCGYEHATAPDHCPLCKGEWQGWELLFAPHALEDLRAQVMGWIAQLPFPTLMEWIASPKGLRVRLYLPPHVAEGVMNSWSAMTGQHSRWRSLGVAKIQFDGYALHTSNRRKNCVACLPTRMAPKVASAMTRRIPGACNWTSCGQAYFSG